MSGIDDSVVWAVNLASNVFRRKERTWEKVAGILVKVISCGEAGVWGVNLDNQVFYRRGTSGGAVM